jgi:hypothetical protein
MSATLARMAPDASEHLRIAARGQHIERWTSSRKSYPEGRVGYLSWRNHLKKFHAERVAQIMTANGYQSENIARVRSLICKERIKSDSEAQLLEDVVCVVFLEYYLGEISAKTDAEKLAAILGKIWKKMSPLGHAHARKLNLPPAIAAFLKEPLSSA